MYEPTHHKPTEPHGVEAPSRAGLRMGAPCSPASSFLRGERFGRTEPSEKGADVEPGAGKASAPVVLIDPRDLAAVYAPGSCGNPECPAC